MAEHTWREQAQQAKRVKIMLVDDSAKVREMIRSLMVGLDAEFVECDNGREALAAYRDRRPDWVLMDLMMPDVDGLTATRQITGAFPGARVPRSHAIRRRTPASRSPGGRRLGLLAEGQPPRGTPAYRSRNRSLPWERMPRQNERYMNGPRVATNSSKIPNIEQSATKKNTL